MAKGRKTCDNCGGINGARSHTCKHCGEGFVRKSVPVKKKFKKQEVKDWQSLRPHDMIKVISGSGPYFQDADKNRHYMTKSGNYFVREIVKDGIEAVGDGSKTSGSVFLYMGRTKRSPICKTLIRSKHKLLRLVKR